MKLSYASAFCFGVILAVTSNYLGLEVYTLILLTLTVLLNYFLWHVIKLKYIKWWIVCICGFIICCTVVYYDEYNNSKITIHYGDYINTQAKIRYVSSSEYDSTLYICPTDNKYCLLAKVYNSTQYNIGDFVWIKGQLKEISNFSDFDYRKYLLAKDVYAEIKKPQVVVLRQGDNKLFILRTKVIQKIRLVYNNKFGTDRGVILTAMIFGIDDGLSKNIKSLFQTSGLTHVLVVSGFNLTIIAQSLEVFGRYIGRKNVDRISIFLIIIYAFLVGLSATVVRAFIMSTLALIGRLLNRPSYGLSNLFWATALMLIFNHNYLFYDIGFQLSTLATLGILIMSSLYSNRKNSLFIDGAFTTFAATIFTLPIISLYFGTVSIWSVFINTIVLPIIPWIMLCGILSILPLLGVVFTYLAGLLINLLLLLLNYLNQHILLQINFKINFNFLFIYYFVLIVLIYFLKKT